MRALEQKTHYHTVPSEHWGLHVLLPALLSHCNTETALMEHLDIIVCVSNSDSFHLGRE